MWSINKITRNLTKISSTSRVITSNNGKTTIKINGKKLKEGTPEFIKEEKKFQRDMKSFDKTMEQFDNTMAEFSKTMRNIFK